MESVKSVCIIVTDVPETVRGGVKWAVLHRGLEFRGQNQVGDSHKWWPLCGLGWMWRPVLEAASVGHGGDATRAQAMAVKGLSTRPPDWAGVKDR